MKYIIISIAFILSGCGLSEEIYQQLLGSINQPAACEDGYIPVSQPPFIGFHVTLNSVPDEYHFRYKDDTVNIYTFLNQIGPTTIYFNGIHIAGFIDGVNSAGSIIDTEYLKALQDGNPASISFGSQRMYTRGALTFSQFLAELNIHHSVKWLSFSAMTLTCAEVDQIMDFLLADCKETPAYIDARNIVGCLSQETIDELELRGSTVRTN